MSAWSAFAAAVLVASAQETPDAAAAPQPLAHLVVHGAGRLASGIATAYAGLGMDGLLQEEHVLTALLHGLPVDADAVDRTAPFGFVLVASSAGPPERVAFCTTVQGEELLAGTDEAAEAAARDLAARRSLFERRAGRALVSFHADLAAIAPRFDRAVAERARLLRAGSHFSAVFRILQGQDGDAGAAAAAGAAALLERLPGALAPWSEVDATLFVDAAAVRIEGRLAAAEGSAAATWIRSLRPRTLDSLRLLPWDAAAVLDLGADASAWLARSGDPTLVALAETLAGDASFALVRSAPGPAVIAVLGLNDAAASAPPDGAVEHRVLRGTEVTLGRRGRFLLAACGAGRADAVARMLHDTAEEAPPRVLPFDAVAVDAPVRGFVSLCELRRLAAAALGLADPAPDGSADQGAMVMSAWPEEGALRFRVVLPLAHLRSAVPLLELR